jgi:uncharacterized protein (TIGR03437 family)
MMRIPSLLCGLAILPVAAAAQAPVVLAVVNAASFTAGEALSPGSMISIFGTNLATATAQAAVIPLPVSLGGAQVFFNATAAPLLYVSPLQINAVIPWGLAADTASVTVVVGGVSSAPATVAIGPSNPGAFVSGGIAAALVVGADGQYKGVMSATNAAQPGDIIELYATGLGAVTNPPRVGSAPGSALSWAALPVAANIGGVPANVLFAGLAPGFADLFQVNIVAPLTFCATCGASGAGASPAPGALVSAPVQVFAGSGASNVATLTLVNPAAAPAPSVASLSASSLSPGADLEISGTFNADAVTVVQFAMAGQTLDVTPHNLQAALIDVVVPVFRDPKSGAFAAATGTVQVMQTVGAQQLASNTSAFSIQNLPQPTATAGQFTAATLLLIEETMQQLAGNLSFVQNAGITPANDGARASLQSFAASTEVFRQAILAASANPSASTTLAIVDGHAAPADATFLTNTDQLIAAPYLGTASGSAPEFAPRDLVGVGPGSCGDAEQDRLLYMFNESTPAPTVTDSSQQLNCWGSGLSQGMGDFVEFNAKLGAWATLIAASGPAGGAIDSAASSIAAGLTAFGLYAGTIGQSMATLMFSQTPPSPQAAQGISNALQSMQKLWTEWATDQTISSALDRIEEGSGALYDWGQALVTVWPDLKSLATSALAPWVSTAGGSPSLSTPVPAPSTLVSGVILDTNQNPVSNAQVTLAANPSSSQAPTATFSDGSYLLCIPTSGIGSIYPSSNTVSIQSGLYSAQQSLDLTKGSQTVNLQLRPPTCSSCDANYTAASNACTTGTLLQQSQCVNAAIGVWEECLDICE